MTDPAAPPGAPERVAVIGGGTMGIGIAYVCATADLQTWIVESAEPRRAELAVELQRALDIGRDRGRLTEAQTADAAKNLTIVSAIDDLPIGLDVIVESVPERAELKRSVLAAALTREPTVLATNT